MNGLNCPELDKLIVRKIVRIVATRCQIFRLKCTKFNFVCGFVWGSIPDPAGELTALLRTPQLHLRGPTSKGKGRGGKGQGREGREGKRKGMEKGEGETFIKLALSAAWQGPIGL